MGIIDAKNIFEESDGIFFITGLIGLRPVRVRKKIFPGYIYMFLLLFIFYTLFFFTINDSLALYESMRTYSLSTRTRTIQALFNPVFLTIIIVSSAANATRIRRLYNELNEVDEKLKLINVHIDYQKFTRFDFARICEIVLITISFNLMEYFPQIAPGTKDFFGLVWITNTYPQFVDSIAIGSFVIIMSKVRRRFEAINAFFVKMPIFETNVSSTLGKDMNKVFKLRLLNKIHGKLVNAATNLNEAYQIVLLTSFTVYFLVCCFHLQIIPSVIGQPKDIIDFMVETLWVLFYIGKYASVVNICHSVALQGKLSGQLLREKWTDVDHHPLKQEMDASVRQIESRNLQLTVCNFFVIEYPTLKGIIVALVGYLVAVTHTSASCNKK